MYLSPPCAGINKLDITRPCIPSTSQSSGQALTKYAQTSVFPGRCVDGFSDEGVLMLLTTIYEYLMVENSN